VRRFGPVTALAGIDLGVAEGEILALLGPNGAGKSTLLRILGTLVLPDEGTATVGGVDVETDPAAARRRVGIMIGDERSLYWRISGRRNLRFFALLHGMDRAAADAAAAELLDVVGLTEAADRPVRGYSSGMRARLSLSRALLGSPRVLLLDEPTRHLDPIAASDFRAIATRLAHERGAGILLATHDLHEAVAVADRVVALSHGTIVLDELATRFDADQLESAFVEAVHVRRPEVPEQRMEAVG
jgi:ABC-2 type transport system ATP-binding protein